MAEKKLLKGLDEEGLRYYDGIQKQRIGNKVDKVSGKDLISTSDITQITTNKTDIATLKTQIASINQILEGLDTTLAQIASELEALA